ncbi:gdp-l-galactose phosphorylase 1-like [Phytophthora cinnamomi]|uniref:gdp-l-galactose phosphorylase 1-like n=1 Tax=Phytophthora cinnamomi TaxID=4785 RepID=UPI003559D43C|nr:gdp-l-galactose phosphorylase 1-like [Phytophthora cinnamomi]
MMAPGGLDEMMAPGGLDELLLRRWDLAASRGVMRTDVNDTFRRRVPGELGLVVQFNPSHLKSKRPVDKQLLAPPTHATPDKPKTGGFNFTKAKSPEFLGGLCFVTDDEQRIPVVHPVELKEREGDTSTEVEHIVLVNVAPLMRGHLLFVLDMNSLRPQKMSEKFLLYALSISQAMQNENFTLGFNSAGAWSSVNHFHLQGYFFPCVEGEASATFPVAAQPRQEVFRADGAIVKVIPTWKTTCFVLEPERAGTDATQVVKIAWALLELLQAQEIPHNLLVVGEAVFVFPRQQQRENGIAVAELSGLVIAGDQVAYDNLTEDMFNTVLEKEVSLPPSTEAVLLAEWKATFGH